MKKIYKLISLLLAMISILLTACGKETYNNPLSGKWAYIHDTETAVLTIADSGKAVYEGSKYDLKIEDEYLILTSSDKKDIKLRYKTNEQGMFIYITTEYLLTEGGSDNALTGTWYCKEKKWSFEFTDDGTFKEDGYFPGYYIDNGDGTFKLIYNDHFEDTTCYYKRTGDTLTVEYPWQLVTCTK